MTRWLEPVFPDQKGYAAKLMRAVLRLHGLCLLNTFENSGPTYWGPRQGTNSRIDFVAAPLDFKNCAKQCRVLERSGQRLQLTQCTPPMPFDHWPLGAIFNFERAKKRKNGKPQEKYDKDALSACLLECWKRKEVIDAVERKLRKTRGSSKPHFGAPRRTRQISY